QFLVMMDFLRQEGFKNVPESKAGIAIHFDSPPDSTQVFQIIDQGRLKNPSAQAELSETLKRLPKDYREYVLKGYSERLHMDAATRQKLRKISEDAQDRSLLIVKTREGYAKWRDEENEILFYQDPKKVETAWGPAAYPLGRTLPEKFAIEGGALVVTSKSEEELLPLEALTGFRVSRKPGETLAEVGRFFVGKDAEVETSPRLLGLAASAILSTRKIDRIIIEADSARARLFERLGFTPIHSQKNYEGKMEYIMEVTPDVFFKRLAERLMDDLPPQAPLPRLAPAEEAVFYSDLENHLVPGDRKSPVVALGGSNASALLTRLQDIALSKAAPGLKLVQMRKGLYASEAFQGHLKAKDADQFAKVLIQTFEENGDPVEALRGFLLSKRWYDLLERYFPTNPFLLMHREFVEIRATAAPLEDKVLHLEAIMNMDSRIVRQFGNEGIARVAKLWLQSEKSGASAAEIATAVFREIRFGN
ncbi:MAG: hypothetical protein ACJ763_16660, partial [Bdellovibrionia bacterium]